MDDDAGPMPPDPSITERLAQTLAVPVVDFVDAFGAGWLPLPDEGANSDALPEEWGSAFGPWHVSGEPYQLTLRTLDDGVELGVPVGSWGGSHGLRWESSDRRTVNGMGPEFVDAARPVIAALLKRRRARFRYCRYCRRLTPPEERLEVDVCYGCGSTWRGVIY
ncbi:hypothetical protein GCM10027026_00810 [Myroides odoratimimus subsp. xuanwuensis]